MTTPWSRWRSGTRPALSSMMQKRPQKRPGIDIRALCGRKITGFSHLYKSLTTPHRIPYKESPSIKILAMRQWRTHEYIPYTSTAGRGCHAVRTIQNDCHRYWLLQRGQGGLDCEGRERR